MNLGNNISDTLDIYVVRHSGWWKVRDKIYWEVKSGALAQVTNALRITLMDYYEIW